MSRPCHEVRIQIEPLIDGELGAGQARDVRAHLASCADCAAEHDLAASLPARLRALTSPAPPPELVPSVMAAVAAEATSPALLWGLPALEVALAALIFFYVSGWQGLARIGQATAGDLSQLLSWGVGGDSLPSPAGADMVLVLAAIALVAVSAAHLAVLSRTTPRLRAGV